MNNKLLQLLEIEAQEIANSYKKASLEGKGTPQEIADRREGYFISYLKKYFPFPYRIVKGNIIDSYGNNSASIDCVILNPSHPYTVDVQSEKASVIFADGVDFAIEIKPNLNNKTEIERALKQIQSVKKLRRVRNGIVFDNNIAENQIEATKRIPCFIVADETYGDIKLLLEKIVDYYIENQISQIEQFDLILINNRATIINARPNMYLQVTKHNWNIDDKRVLAFWEDGSKSMAWFLYEMNRYPRSEPLISESIMEIYLENSIPKTMKTFDKLNKKLVENGV